VSDHAAKALAELGGTGSVELTGTLAFYDVSGFTKLTERLSVIGRAGAEHINDVLVTIFTALIQRVLDAGGDVLEFGGDAMVVLFDGVDHHLRAARATRSMFDVIEHEGVVQTPLGPVRLRMSCGMASGTQQYHLAGVTRKALVVAGPVSTAMALLESAARSGEALVDPTLAALLPKGWTERRRTDAATRLRLPAVEPLDLKEPVVRTMGFDDRHAADLLPTQFRSLVEGSHRAGELKQVAMAFIRLNATDDLLAELGAAELTRTIVEISAIVDGESTALDVCWLETQAEANSVRWTLISGAPTATEHDGERLLRVVRRIADRSPHPLRIGANLGVVFVGDMGHPQRCTYIVMGDTTNLAARLMAKAAPGQIIAGERLHSSCAGRFEVTPIEPFMVKGKRAPVNAVVVHGITSTGESGPARPVDATSRPLVGRQRELAELLRALDAGGITELVGEAGVGKTRLWHEARGRRPDRTWHLTRAEPHETASPYLPFRRLLCEFLQIDAHADAEVAGAHLTAQVAAHLPQHLDWLPLIADVIGVTVENTDAVLALDPDFRASARSAATADFLVDLMPPNSVVVLEDLHWVDDGSRALVESLGGRLRSDQALLVTRRPEGWEPDATTVHLGAIDAADATALVLAELPQQLASDAVLAHLQERGGGNPLFLIELAKAVASSPDPTMAYPDTVERVLTARIDRLPIPGRELLRDVSVLGSAVDLDLASRVLERPELRTPSAWLHEVGDLLRTDGTTLRFDHDLVRVAAYEGLSVRRRRALHQRAGDVIDEWGDAVPVPDRTASLAFHASGSGLPDRVARWGDAAARAAMSRGTMETAERLLRDVVTAQRTLTADTSVRGETLRRLALAAERAGDPEVALQALEEASRLADRHERPAIASERARILEKLGRYRAALVTTARALSICDDPFTAARLQLTRASVRNFLGQWNEALQVSRTLLADPRLAAETRMLAQAHLLAAWACDCLGLPERAEHEEAAVGLLTSLDDFHGLANVLLNRGVSEWSEGRADSAADDFAASARHYRRAGDVVGAALADNNVAEVLTLQMRLDEAEEILQRAQRVLHAAGYTMGAFSTLSGRSRVAAYRRDIREALDMQQRALAGFRSLGVDDLVIDSLARLAEINVIDGATAEALANVEEATALLVKRGDRGTAEATLHRLRSRALELDGRIDDARTASVSALQVATASGTPYDIAMAELLLGRLEGDHETETRAHHRLQAMGVRQVPPSL
jgi:class 3 adenylate cyclase/tetratricopeptide (TPR) repeat protein